MKRLNFVIPVIFLAAFFLAAGSEAQDLCSEPVITAEGKVIGVADEKQPVCVYKGVPYAAPPVGKLRFRPPAPPRKRAELFKADQYSAECVQGGGAMPGVRAVPRSEDCLYLNIWRPQKSGKFPVMLWIHGGSLTSGSGVIPLYFGDRLAQKDVVVITINYRLAWLGFLAHRDLSAEDPNNSSGNYGLLDQIEALKWVKRNIAGFRGDPDNVTIFGESAGGWSVCNLLASPPAAGFFSKAIIESGGCQVATSLEQGYELGEQFAKEAGCEFRDPIPCLRGKTTEEIELAREVYKPKENLRLEKEGKQKSGGALSLEDAKFEWTPRVDGWVLDAVPIEAIRSGNFNRVPLMVGTNKDEFKLFLIAAPGARSLIPKSFISKELYSILGADTAAGIERLYPYKDYRKPLDAVGDALGDAALGCPCYQAAEGVSKYAPVYYYRFDFTKHRFPHMIGAAHAVEIPFIFDTLDRGPANLIASKKQRQNARPLVNDMMGYWTNFAKTGNPNDPASAGLTPWPKYDTVKRERMYLDIPVKAQTTDNVEKCEFWRRHDIMKQ